ncbi:MAG: hypothetical protein ABEJ05_02700 [Haloglomus sp.]
MTDDSNPTRRRVLRTGAAALAAGVGIGSLGSVAAKSENGKQFGRVWANDVLWRTNVVRKLDERPDKEDVVYFVNDGTKASLPGGGDGTANANASPFVSESAPGDQDWNGGQWVHKAATLDDGVTLDKPLTSEAEVLAAEKAGKLTISDRRPYLDGTTTAFGPPRYFICPLNGRA